MTTAAFPPVASLLPHDPPMVLLDAVVAKGPTHVTCAVRPRHDAPFVREGQVDVIVTLEYMAQAVGVFAGLEASARGEPVEWGFLIGCPEMRLERDAIAAGTPLEVVATRVWGDARLGQFACCVTDGDGERVATATLNVALARPSEVPR